MRNEDDYEFQIKNKYFIMYSVIGNGDEFIKKFFENHLEMITRIDKKCLSKGYRLEFLNNCYEKTLEDVKKQ